MKISIITVCYNAATDLEKTILSVTSQSYKDIEYIIIDGGSKDNTLEVIKKHQKNITKWISEPDKGIYDAMNKGIEASTGEWINFMNAGDTFAENDVLEKVFIKNYPEDIGVIYGDAILCYPNIGYVKRSYADIKESDEPLNINHQSTFIKGNLLRKIKYNLEYKIASDGYTFMIIKSEGYRFLYLPQSVAVFEVVSGVSSRMFVRRTRELLQVRGVKRNSYQWFKSLTKAYCKAVVQTLLPNKLLSKLQYKRIMRKYQNK